MPASGSPFHQPVFSVLAVHRERLPHHEGGTRYAHAQTEILVHAAHVADDDKDKRRQQPACENEQVLGFKPFELDRPADSLVNLPHGLQEKAS